MPSSSSEQPVEQLAGASDERLALEVLVAPRCLADEHQVGVRVAHAEDHLGPRLPPAGIAVQVAASAATSASSVPGATAAW